MTSFIGNVLKMNGICKIRATTIKKTKNPKNRNRKNIM